MAGKNKQKTSIPVKVDMRMVVAVLVCVALSGALYFFFTAPMRKDAEDLKVSVAEAQATVDRNQKRILDIKTGKQSNAAELYQQAQQLDGELPADIDKIALVAQLSTLAQQYNVEIGQMDPLAAANSAATSGATTSEAGTDKADPSTGADKPAPATPTRKVGASANVRSQTFTVSATGSADALSGLLSAIQTYPSTLAVSGLTFNISGEGQATATFTLKAFFVPTASLLPGN